MTNMSLTHEQPVPAPLPTLRLPLVLLLATGAGVAVAMLYASQPLLGLIGPELQAGPAALGGVPTLTQLGYALGIGLLAPLGDRHDRRRLIAAKAALLALALLAAAAAPGIGALLLASLAIGVTATLAQDIVPAAATLAPPAQRGQVVGTVMTGLLLGILLSRVVAGAVAAQLGWRAVLVGGAGAVALLGAALWRALPRLPASTTLPYGALLQSLATLWRQQPALRRAALAQGLLSVGFSAFWSTLAVMLAGAPYHLGSAAAGAFGLAGAAGALAAPLAGRLADRRGPAVVARIGSAIATLAFAGMGLAAFSLAQPPLGVLAVGAVLFDFGVQAALIAHQTLVYGLAPAARSRLNALLFVGVFLGMASGAALGSALLGWAGWPAVMALATLASLGAGLVASRR